MIHSFFFVFLFVFLLFSCFSSLSFVYVRLFFLFFLLGFLYFWLFLLYFFLLFLYFFLLSWSLFLWSWRLIFFRDFSSLLRSFDFRFILLIFLWIWLMSLWSFFKEFYFFIFWRWFFFLLSYLSGFGLDNWRIFSGFFFGWFLLNWKWLIDCFLRLILLWSFDQVALSWKIFGFLYSYCGWFIVFKIQSSWFIRFWFIRLEWSLCFGRVFNILRRFGSSFLGFCRFLNHYRIFFTFRLNHTCLSLPSGILWLRDLRFMSKKSQPFNLSFNSLLLRFIVCRFMGLDHSPSLMDMLINILFMNFLQSLASDHRLCYPVHDFMIFVKVNFFVELSEKIPSLLDFHSHDLMDEFLSICFKLCLCSFVIAPFQYFGGLSFCSSALDVLNVGHGLSCVLDWYINQYYKCKLTVLDLYLTESIFYGLFFDGQKIKQSSMYCMGFDLEINKMTKNIFFIASVNKFRFY